MAKDGMPPGPDFAIFGPYASRFSWKLKFTSLVFDAGGVLENIQLTGPDSFAAWFDCYQVWRCCLIMLDIAELAAIEAYCENGARTHLQIWLRMLRYTLPERSLMLQVHRNNVQERMKARCM
eukprot:826038-Amphidinium_carterae.2